MISETSATRIAQARKAGEFTDFAFACAGKTLHVHRIIVCSQSSVLHEACAGRTGAPGSRIYNMDEHPLSIVERMVDYLYTGNYADTIDPDISNTVDNSSILSVHAAMCALADKYGIQGLADLSTSKYGKALQKIPDLKSFILSVPHVYGSKSQTSPGLRDWAVAFAREKIPAHLSDPEIKRDFDRCISENREFMQDMLYSALLHPLIGVCFNCGPVTPADTYQCRCKDCSETGAVIGEHMDRN